MKQQRLPLRLLVFTLSLVLILFLMIQSGEGFQALRKISGGHEAAYAADDSTTHYFPFAGDESTMTIHYFPFVAYTDPPAGIELTGAWTQDSGGQIQDTYYLGEPIQYISSGVNPLDEPVSAELTWTLEGPCGTTEIYKDNVILPAGIWQHVNSELTPGCSGDYIGRVRIDQYGISSTLTTTFQVHLPSQVVINDKHGFDRCWLPTVGQMQTWWNQSPYYVWNIYLGGIHYFCSSIPATPAWVQSVAQQGWKFILTWVGPQPPCSQFTHKFSSNPLKAFGEGIDEAAAALAAAEALGISREKIIYYDLEFYPSSDTACNQAVNEFLEGWTAWLQLQGDKSGVYASPCNSNIKEWVNISPPPDDVWIAHWIYSSYNPAATVWDVACSLPNTYWADHQRIRQYAGDHTEIWGGVAMTIDSDVLDGEITAITGSLPIAGPPLTTPETEHSVVSGIQIRAMELTSPDTGWLLTDDRLLLTEDGGGSWHEITPGIGNAILRDVDFTDAEAGWAAGIPIDTTGQGGLAIYHTQDGGVAWVAHPLPISMTEIAGVDLEFIDDQTGWVMLKSKTGSSFSVGRLFATVNGGLTWEERTAPMGEPVVFVDRRNGWMVGGPAGNQIFRTQDGGQTWQPLNLPDLPDGQAYLGQPEFESLQSGILPVTLFGSSRSSLLIYETVDGGNSWRMTRNIELSPGFEAGAALPFSFTGGRWWAVVKDSRNLLTSGSPAKQLERSSTTGLPPGVVRLDYITADVGWALVQDNQCYGDKIPGNTSETSPFYCHTGTHLYRTNDGGTRWDEIQLP